MNNQKEIIRVDFQKILSKMLSYWWLFLLCMGIAIGGANIYLKHATFKYSARAILLLKDIGKNAAVSMNDILHGEKNIKEKKGMSDQIQIIKSLTLFEKVIKRLGLNVQYFRIGQLKEIEIHMDSPFLLDSFQLYQPNTFAVTFFLELADNESFLLKQSKEEVGTKYYYNVPFENQFGRFTIYANPEVERRKGDYRLTIGKNEVVANYYKNQVTVQRIGNFTSGMLEIKLLDPVPEKASSIVNTLIAIYNEEEVRNENRIFVNTLEFIDDRMSHLVSELDSVERGIQIFKSENEVFSNDASSSMGYALEEIRTSVQKKSNFEIQKNLLKSLENLLLEEDFEKKLIPLNFISENTFLSGLVNQHNELVVHNTQMTTTASEKNPSRIILEERIIDTRNLILETIQNQRKDIEIPLKEINENLEELRTNLANIPVIEKKLLEKARTQKVKEQLLLFLMQKRENTAIKEETTPPKIRIVDSARTPDYPVYPQRKLILVTSSVLGFFVPFLFVLVSGLFETKIDSEASIKQRTTIPILGKIAQKKEKESIIIKRGQSTKMMEMFRLLRTKLNLINNEKSKQVIMLTSSIAGEGKTFIALNLGITMSLSDKKVILLSMDFRQPQLAKSIGVPQGRGITNYLMGENELEELIQPFKGYPNLSYMTSGAYSHNASEFFLSNKMKQFMDELGKRFDCILIDTPPIGLVSDGLLLRKYVDNTLIVVRNKFTPKEMINNLENMHKNQELKKANIIFYGDNSIAGYGRYPYQGKQNDGTNEA